MTGKELNNKKTEAEEQHQKSNRRIPPERWLMHRLKSRRHIRREKRIKNDQHKNEELKSPINGLSIKGCHKLEGSVRRNSDKDDVFQKIFVKNINGASEDEILAELNSVLEEDYTPLASSIDNDCFSFYLENRNDIADALQNLSHRISLEDRKLVIDCTIEMPSYTDLTTKQLITVLKVISDRYNEETKCLDLKNFHNDPMLLQSRIFCPLFQSEGLHEVVNIILRHFADLIELDLSHNRICSVRPLTWLKNSGLKRINLEGNQIFFFRALQIIQGLPILELTLEGNPVVSTFNNEENYAPIIRRVFPRLRYLDGIEIESAEIEKPLNIPLIIPSFYCDKNIENVVMEFIKKYYDVFHSEKREEIQSAYTEEALFSLISLIPQHLVTSQKHFSDKFFAENNRNLLRVRNNNKRFETLLQGRKDIVKKLCLIPEFKTNQPSLVIDIPCTTPQFIHVCISGFMEMSVDHKRVCRSFTRSLVLVPVGESYCISNEQFSIRVPISLHKLQYKSEGKLLESLTRSMNMKEEPKQPSFQDISLFFNESMQNKERPSTSNVSPLAISSSEKNGSEIVYFGLESHQVEMVKKFHEATNMLIPYCKECLERSDWDIDLAGTKFVNLNKANKIPAEYFKQRSIFS